MNSLTSVDDITEEQANELISDAFARKDLSQIKELANTNAIIHKVFAYRVQHMVANPIEESLGANTVATSGRISAAPVNSSRPSEHSDTAAHMYTEHNSASNKAQHLR